MSASVSSAGAGEAGLDPEARASARALAHLPGGPGWPVVGHTLSILRDNLGFTRRMYARHGPVYVAGGLRGAAVTVIGPGPLGRVLGDRTGTFSSERGLGPYFATVFPNSLMVLDGAHHHGQRRIMAAAFKPDALRRYIGGVDRFIGDRLATWGGARDVYATNRRFTLDLASQVFLGLPPGPEAREVSAALQAMVAATAALVRRPLPLTRMRKGIRGRRFMVDFLRRLVPERRGRDGDDLLTLLCAASDEDGNRFTDDEVIDHTVFMWLAAHDTLTSSLSAMCDELAWAPEWQGAVRAECAALSPDDRLIAAVNGQPITDQVFKETLRLHPPVGALPRRTTRAVEVEGRRLPAGTEVFANISTTQRLAEVWPDPDAFDPRRFGADAPKPARYAWVPYGVGPHTCLGARYAAMTARVFARQLLTRFRVEPVRPARATWTVLPLRRPHGGLPLRFVPLSEESP